MATDLEHRILELERENATLRRDLTETLDQQSATAEILRVMSQSYVDYQPVLDSVTVSARRVCRAEMTQLHLVDGLELVTVSRPGGEPGTPLGVRRSIPADSPIYNIQMNPRTVHVRDCTAQDEFLDLFPRERAYCARLGCLVTLYVPLLRQGTMIGLIAIGRLRAEPFSAKEIALIELFANQAVIAIENARLFQELEQRTHQLARTVEELRALGEVGQAVNSSLDLRVVLETVLVRAVELTGSNSGIIYTFEAANNTFQLQIALGNNPQLADEAHARFGVSVQHPLEVMPELAEPLRRGEPVQMADVFADEPFGRQMNRATRYVLQQLGVRSTTLAPLTHDGRLQGMIAISRHQPGVIAPDALALLQTFANQSALAIQNARLYAQIERQRLELDVKSRQLAEISRHKSEFLANMSHELRTPLNGIIGFSEVLLDPSMPVDDAMRTQFLANILNAGKHQLNLINDILDLSKVESGKMELQPEEFNVADALQGVHAVVRALTDKKQQTLGLVMPAESVSPYHDLSRFKQVLFNLLSNAVKFTPEGGSITTTVRLVGEKTDLTSQPRSLVRKGEVAEASALAKQDHPAESVIGNQAA